MKSFKATKTGGWEVVDDPISTSMTLELADLSRAVNAMAANIPVTPLEGERYEMPSKAAKSNKKKEKNMCFECGETSDYTIEDRRIDYLEHRLSSIQWSKRAELRKQFGLEDDAAPETFSELQERLTSGKFIIADDRKDKRVYNPLQYVKWRDPAVKEDQKGFKEAEKKLDDLFIKTMDQIKILPQTDGLKALQEFESATIN